MTSNKRLLKKLANLGVLKTEPIKLSSFANENDIIITKSNDSKEKVILDKDTTNEELLLMIEAENLETLKSIKNMIKFFVVSTLIGAGIWLFNFLLEFSSHG
jgi:hypothetical protein